MENKTEQTITSKPKVKASTIIKTAVFTVVAILCSVAFGVMCLTVIAPQKTADTLKEYGFKDVHYTIYKRVYNRHSTNENLYNVIQHSISRKNYADMEFYIKEMLNGDSFAKFAKKIDEQTKLKLGDKYSIYTDSYEQYIRGNLVLALYNNNKDIEAKMRAIDSVYNNVREMYIYVNCVETDENLTELQKESEMTSLNSRYGVSDELNKRLQELDDEYNMAIDNTTKVIVLQQKVLIVDIMTQIAKYTTPEELENLNNLRNKYTKEINSLTA